MTTMNVGLRVAVECLLNSKCVAAVSPSCFLLYVLITILFLSAKAHFYHFCGYANKRARGICS